MIYPIRRAGSLMLCICAAMLMLGVANVRAQIVWNPPCNTLTINNRSGCPVSFGLSTTPAGVIPPPIVIASGGFVQYQPIGTLFSINGVISNGGNFYPVTLGGPTPPAPAPPFVPCAWIQAVNLGTSCCCDIYFDCSAACGIWVMPTTFVGPCKP